MARIIMGNENYSPELEKAFNNALIRVPSFQNNWLNREKLLRAYLNMLDFKIKYMPKDGNCMYSALAESVFDDKTKHKEVSL
jgi:hypothetical protein